MLPSLYSLAFLFFSGASAAPFIDPGVDYVPPPSPPTYIAFEERKDSSTTLWLENAASLKADGNVDIPRRDSLKDSTHGTINVNLGDADARFDNNGYSTITITQGQPNDLYHTLDWKDVDSDNPRVYSWSFLAADQIAVANMKITLYGGKNKYIGISATPDPGNVLLNATMKVGDQSFLANCLADRSDKEFKFKQNSIRLSWLDTLYVESSGQFWEGYDFDGCPSKEVKH